MLEVKKSLMWRINARCEKEILDVKKTYLMWRENVRCEEYMLDVQKKKLDEKYKC